jgi:hypothetical protein
LAGVMRDSLQVARCRMSHPRHPKAYKGGGTEVFGKLLEFGIHTPSFAWAGARRGIRATTLQGRIAPLATLLVRPTIYGPGTP